MTESGLLSDDFLRQIMSVGEADIVVGLSTHNHAKTIEPVMAAIQAGILKWFSRERVVIVNADGGSNDGTVDMVAKASINDLWRESKVYALRTLPSISVPYGRSPDSSKGVQAILAATDLLRARTCVVISPESTSIGPEWLQRLAGPIYRDNFDLVCPIYSRPKFEGALVRNLLYPMTRSVYGSRVREPYASEFAISGRLAAEFVGREFGNDDWGRIGPEISLTIMALVGKYRVCQSFLGSKTQSVRTTPDIVGDMRRTVGALFSSMESNFPMWSAVQGSEPTPVFGTYAELQSESLRINRKRLLEMFSTGVAQLSSVLQSILSEATLRELQRIAALGVDDFIYESELWVKTVFEFVAAYHKSVINRDHIIQALVPLYRGRSLTFLMENRDSSEEQIDKYEESLCADFERLKPYLLDVWAERK